MTFTGLTGTESVGPLDVYSVSGSALTVAPAGGSGSGTGKVRVSPLSITKPIDQNSPRLFASIVNGRHIKSVTVTTSTGSGQVLTLSLGDVLVTVEALASTPDGSIIERIELTYSKITYSAGAASATWPAGGKG